MPPPPAGAQLISVVNSDENKTFGAVFRTPVTDSTGIPHILEHSVLCGSRWGGGESRGVPSGGEGHPRGGGQPRGGGGGGYMMLSLSAFGSSML